MLLNNVRRIQEQYVDATAMRLIKAPNEFDVTVTTNIFDDIISQETAQMGGRLCMTPAANVGDSYGIFDPIHDSASDITGKQLANLRFMILVSKIMLEWLGEQHNDHEGLSAGKWIENAGTKILSAGLNPSNIARVTPTSEKGDTIANHIYRVWYLHEKYDLEKIVHRSLRTKFVNLLKC